MVADHTVRMGLKPPNVTGTNPIVGLRYVRGPCAHVQGESPKAHGLESRPVFHPRAPGGLAPRIEPDGQNANNQKLQGMDRT